MDINGCIAVVTGSGSGIGKAIALALANEGADVVVADINDDWIDNVCHEIEALGRKTLGVHTDVSKYADIQNLYNKSIQAMGRVDILVNNAGIHMIGPINLTTLEDWKEIVDTNLWSVIYGVHTFFPISRNGEADILLILHPSQGKSAWKTAIFLIQRLNLALSVCRRDSLFIFTTKGSECRCSVPAWYKPG